MPSKPVIPELYIGIDPDVKASGFAVWDKKKIGLCCYDLTDLLDMLLHLHKNHMVMVRLEAGWLIKKKSWHRGGMGSANSVGRNHEIGRQVEKFCQKHQIPYALVKPAGYSSFTHERFCAITGWPISKRTNPETRVAGMLVYGWSGIVHNYTIELNPSLQGLLKDSLEKIFKDYKK